MTTFSEFEASRYVRTIIETMEHCHRHNIVHRGVDYTVTMFYIHVPVLIWFVSLISPLFRLEFKL